MVKVTNKCPACGEQTRSNAIFCHHCGRPLPAVKVAAELPPPAAETHNLQPEVLTTNVETVVVKPLATAPPPTIEPASSSNHTNGLTITADDSSAAATEKGEPNFVVETSDVADAIPVAPPPPPQPRRRKRYVSQTEVVWEEAEAPIWRILLFAVLAFLVVAGLVWVSSSFK